MLLDPVSLSSFSIFALKNNFKKDFFEAYNNLASSQKKIGLIDDAIQNYNNSIYNSNNIINILITQKHKITTQKYDLVFYSTKVFNQNYNNFLIKNKREEDEIVILYDINNGDVEVEKYLRNLIDKKSNMKVYNE
mgnify:CR=1 FL=1